MRSVCRWLLIAIAATALGCLLPGSAVSAAPLVNPVAAIEVPVPTEAGIACAVVSCGHVSPSTSTSVPAVVVIGVLVGLSLCIPVARARRRIRPGARPLPAGVREDLLRPPKAFRLA
jgi:hypothetical protein